MELLMAQIPKFERGHRKEFLTKRFGLYQRNLDTKQVIKFNSIKNVNQIWFKFNADIWNGPSMTTK